LKEAEIPIASMNQLVIASVVEPLMPLITEAVWKSFRVNTIVIDSNSNLGITNLTNPPEATGIDRLLNVAAAYHIHRRACIVVDFGTATTINVVDGEGGFLGGAICAGLRTTANALTEAAPRLAQIELAAPAETIGSNTQQALRNGVVLGHALMVDGLVTRMSAQLVQQSNCTPAVVIATGGLSSVVGPLCDTVDEIDPSLTIKGIALVYARIKGMAA
jgi:type III pantothenate kinase